MYHLTIHTSFAAAHNLLHYQGDCENLHGHNWKVEVTVKTEALNKSGLGIDFKILKKETKSLLGTLDHKYLNELPAFKDTSPSSENIARFLLRVWKKTWFPTRWTLKVFVSGSLTMPAPPSPEPNAHLIEIFSSIQGEGPWVGVRQIFIRFGGCNLACSYCDTGIEAGKFFCVEEDPGSGIFRKVANPASLAFVAKLVASWKKVHPRVYHSISLTGGEPLIHEHVLLEWLPKLRELLPLYLETNGTLPDALKKVLPYLDFIAMDIKLSSVTGMPTPWDAHRRFLELAAQSRCCVKIVAGMATSEEELIRAASMVRTVAPDVVLVLQPLSAEGKVAVPADKLLRMQELAAGIHGDVRVIPQNHPFMKLL